MPNRPPTATGGKRSRAKPPELRKRLQYVARACKRCQARKTKCDGNTPCETCLHFSEECHYANEDSPLTRYRITEDVEDNTMGNMLDSLDPNNLRNVVSDLQKKVSALEKYLWKDSSPVAVPSSPSVGVLEPLGARLSVSGPPKFSRVPLLPEKRPPSLVFCGPSSANYGFGVIQAMLQPISNNQETASRNNLEIPGSIVSNTTEDRVFRTSDGMQTSRSLHVLRSIDLEEAVRLASVYHKVVGVLHPIIDPTLLETQIQTLWHTMEGTNELSEVQISTDEVDCMKLIFAIALEAEGAGYDDKASEIYGSVQSAIVQRLLGTRFLLQDQIFLLLVVTYHLFHEDYRMASRIVAVAVRLIMESGLHRQQILTDRFPDPAEQKQAVIVLYTTIVLDRQLCFAAGLPYVLKDHDVDLPILDGGSYLQAMSSYIRIGAYLWEQLLDYRGQLKPAFKDEDFDFMEYQVMRWQQALPQDLRPDLLDGSLEGTVLREPEGGETFSIRVLLYLRANQIRILILRPILFSSQTATAHLQRVQSLIDVARDSINTLVRLDRTSDVYRKQQAFHNHFMASALSALFLVVVQQSSNPSYMAEDATGPYCYAAVCDTIFNALDLIKSYASHSRSCRSLLHRIESPRGLLTKLGLLRRNNLEVLPGSQRTKSSQLAELWTSTSDSRNTGLDNIGECSERDRSNEMPFPEGSQQSADLLGENVFNVPFSRDIIWEDWTGDSNFLFENFL